MDIFYKSFAHPYFFSSALGNMSQSENEVGGGEEMSLELSKALKAELRWEGKRHRIDGGSDVDRWFTLYFRENAFPNCIVLLKKQNNCFSAPMEKMTPGQAGAADSGDSAAAAAARTGASPGASPGAPPGGRRRRTGRAATSGRARCRRTRRSCPCRPGGCGRRRRRSSSAGWGRWWRRRSWRSRTR